MNIKQEELDHWRKYLETVRVVSIDAAQSIDAGRTVAAREMLEQMVASAARMGVKLEMAGATRPEGLPPAPDVPLHLLDTPAQRQYLERLRAARDVGIAVDRERGYADGTGPRAGMLGLLIEAVELEVFGPHGG